MRVSLMKASKVYRIFTFIISVEKVLLTSHPNQHLVWLGFLISVNLLVKMYLIMALICISPITTENEHFFLFL